MLLCVTLFTLWLQKFEFGNCCWNTGTFGWFMTHKDEPISGWYTFDKDTKINFGDGVDYTKDSTNYFTVYTKRDDLDHTGIIIQHGNCKLDGKKYLYEERALVVPHG